MKLNEQEKMYAKIDTGNIEEDLKNMSSIKSLKTAMNISIKIQFWGENWEDRFKLVYYPTTFY